MSKSKRVVAPFQSEYGTFNPGDAAIAITVCTGRVHVDRVEYVGYVERNAYNYQERKYTLEKFAQIRRRVTRFTPFYKGTDNEATWPYQGEVEYRNIPGTLVTTLQYNRLIPANASTDQLMKVI